MEPAPARLRRIHLLDELPSLAAELPPRTRALARRALTAAVVHVTEGERPLQEWYGTSLRGPGLLVLRGVIVREVHVAGRTSTELLGPGDLLRPWDLDPEEPVPCTVSWRVLEPADLAVLDAFFADRLRPFTHVAGELLSCAEHRAESLAVQHAIAGHPRVDLRVAMLLWHLAGRWGRVGADGAVRLSLPLTHRLIGELIGAERPSVSHAVARLARAGLVSRDEEAWRLHGTPDEHARAAEHGVADPRRPAGVIEDTGVVAPAAATA